MPFAQASRLLTLLVGVQVGKETVRRLTEHAGRHMEQAQPQAAKAPWPEDPTKIVPAARLVMSADGAYVPLVKGEWDARAHLGHWQGQTVRRGEKVRDPCQ